MNHTETKTTPAQRLRKMAIEARVQYGQETAGGGDPPYPAWADDMLEVLERVAAIEQIPPHEVERVIKASLPDGHRLGINWDAVGRAAKGDVDPGQISFNAAEVLAIYIHAPGLRPMFVPLSVYRQAQADRPEYITGTGAADMARAGYGQPAASVEPVAWLRNERGNYQGKAVFDPLVLLSSPTPGFYTATYSPVYTAPQPAEPCGAQNGIQATQPAEPVKLECPKCGIDRAKSPCAGNLVDCEFKGVAHAAEPVKVPECSCEACEPNTAGNIRMIVCGICGNKRCPHATDHRNHCTGSNEPGQKGSSYEYCKPPISVEAETSNEPVNVGWCEGCTPDNCTGCGPYKPAEPVKVPSDEHLIETGCYQTVIERHSQPAASAEPNRENMIAAAGKCMRERLAEIRKATPPEKYAAPVAQEPVAFLCRECDEEGWSTYVVMPHEVPSTGEFLHVEPLYAAPVAAQVQPVVNRQMTTAARDVLAERQRQIEAEGWAPEHDDSHHTGEMALAAGCYAMYAHHPDYYGTGPRENRVPRMWPWADEWWKQAPPRRMLVKAGALILAEIERLDRAALRNPAPTPEEEEAWRNLEGKQ